jgi:alkylhydroperoxidase family enzyme
VTSRPRVMPAAPGTDGGLLDQMMAAVGGGEPLRLFKTVARHHDLARSLIGPAALMINGSTTVRVDREVVVLRTCALAGCATEWGIHATAVSAAGLLTGEQIDATWSPARPAVWKPQHTLALALAERLHREADLDDDLWDRCAAEWTPEQLLELIAAAGFYRMVSMLANTTRVPAETWARPVPLEVG